MEFLGIDIWFQGNYLAKLRWSSHKHQTMSYHKESCQILEMRPKFGGSMRSMLSWVVCLSVSCITPGTCTLPPFFGGKVLFVQSIVCFCLLKLILICGCVSLNFCLYFQSPCLFFPRLIFYWCSSHPLEFLRDVTTFKKSVHILKFPTIFGGTCHTESGAGGAKCRRQQAARIKSRTIY